MSQPKMRVGVPQCHRLKDGDPCFACNGTLRTTCTHYATDLSSDGLIAVRREDCAGCQGHPCAACNGTGVYKAPTESEIVAWMPPEPTLDPVEPAPWAVRVLFPYAAPIVYLISRSWIAATCGAILVLVGRYSSFPWWGCVLFGFMFTICRAFIEMRDELIPIHRYRCGCPNRIRTTDHVWKDLKGGVISQRAQCWMCHQELMPILWTKPRSNEKPK